MRLKISKEEATLGLKKYLSGFDDLKNHKNITTTALGTIKVLSYLIIPISLPAYGAYRFLQKEKEEEGLKLISSLFAKQDDKEA